MLRVKTKLGGSAIEGIGLFANQFIPKDTVVWEYNPIIDLKLRKDEIESLAEGARQQVQKYSYREEMSGLYIFCGDDARFFNHSEHPNCVSINWGPFGGRMIAERDINKGEELTCNYASFDKDVKNDRYKISERREERFMLPSTTAMRRSASER